MCWAPDVCPSPYEMLWFCCEVSSGEKAESGRWSSHLRNPTGRSCRGHTWEEIWDDLDTTALPTVSTRYHLPGSAYVLFVVWKWHQIAPNTCKSQVHLEYAFAKTRVGLLCCSHAQCACSCLIIFVCLLVCLITTKRWYNIDNSNKCVSLRGLEQKKSQQCDSSQWHSPLCDSWPDAFALHSLAFWRGRNHSVVYSSLSST